MLVLPHGLQESELQGLRRAQAAVALRARIPAAQITTFETVPYMSAFVAPAQLRRLLRDPEVLSIQEDIPIRLQAYDSIALREGTKSLCPRGVSSSDEIDS